jgi:hypothetical protein
MIRSIGWRGGNSDQQKAAKDAILGVKSGSLSLQGKPLSGYVRMTQVQAAYLGSGNAGSGVLKYRESSYPFTVGGLGI